MSVLKFRQNLGSIYSLQKRNSMFAEKEGSVCTLSQTHSLIAQGCYEKVKTDVKTYAVYVGIAGIGIGLIEVSTAKYLKWFCH